MKIKKYILFALICLLCPDLLRAEISPSWIVDDKANSSFTIIDNSTVATICYDADDYPGIISAINNLRDDIVRVTGKSPLMNSGENLTRRPIIIGSLQHCRHIQELAKAGKLNLEGVKDKWESSLVTTLSAVSDTVSEALVITGSDMRAVIYGIYELSQQIGVSPWYWWADVTPLHRDNLWLGNVNWKPGEPGVKYRGIFINDEFPCLTSWAREKFGGVNSLMYKHVYELLLRLRANTLWPAMWGSFKEYIPLVPILKDEQGNFEGNCFNEDDPANAKLANDMGIIIGTSHHEPMQRSQQEWIRHKQDYGNSQWNYMTNKSALKRFFKEGIEHTRDYESIITIGMRGDEDRPMVDAGSVKANLDLLSSIISDQRNIISQVTGRPASATPQVLTLYSEMLDYYQIGLKIPDDVIIMFCDNNFGDIRSIPDLQNSHKGGYGMYYHLEYYGGPRSSKWLNMMQIQQVWEQMSTAYAAGIDKMWIVNVGDIKPLEYPLDFFMRMAWKPGSFTEDNLSDYGVDFCKQQFGEVGAEVIADLLNRYCKYASRVTAEMLDADSYNLETGEYKQVSDEFLALEAEAVRMLPILPLSRVDAYQELVLFPIQAMANLYDMYYSLACNRRYYAEKDLKANYWADRVKRCYERDSLLCRNYNINIAGGKWNHMMDQVHIGYTEWNAPRYNKMPEVKYLSSGDAVRGKYIYKNDGTPVVMEAEHYYSATSANEKNWHIIPDYGRTLSGVAVMPTNKAVGDMSLTYRISDVKSDVDSVNVTLILKSVMPFVKGGHKVKIGFSGAEAVEIDVNSLLTWEHKYDLMYPAGADRIIKLERRIASPASQNGCVNLVYTPLSPGIVIQKLILSTDTLPDTRLNLAESKYIKDCY